MQKNRFRMVKYGSCGGMYYWHDTVSRGHRAKNAALHHPRDELNDKGRLPQRASLKTKDAFLHYVRSAINSVIDAAKRSREMLFIHETIHREKDSESQERVIVLTALPSPDADPAMVDLKAELFDRLCQLAPARLLPTIAEWEKTFFWASQVPMPGTRRHQEEVRKLAMRVLRKIARDLGR